MRPLMCGSPYALLGLLLPLLFACTVGPDYKAPALETPESLELKSASDESIATIDLPETWWNLFYDSTLDALISETLANNRDFLAAAKRVEQARARFVITHSEQQPLVAIQGKREHYRSTERGNFPFPQPISNRHRLVAFASWELDFWGKYRRATEAAQAELTATEAGREAVRLSLIAEVIRGYFALCAINQQITIMEQLVALQQQSLSINAVRLQSGAIATYDYHQYEAELANNEVLLSRLEQANSEQESALLLLLGRNSSQVFSDTLAPALFTANTTIQVPVDLPSEWLLNRPDLREAEARLIAANARIGEARAAYFPSITLTGHYGGESVHLRDLFVSQARIWSAAAELIQPLTAIRTIRSAVKAREAKKAEALLLYRQAVANAFREVRNAINRQTNTEKILNAQHQRADALLRVFELAELRYEAGEITLFELIDIKRQNLSSVFDLIEAEQQRRSAMVDLYSALGL